MEPEIPIVYTEKAKPMGGPLPWEADQEAKSCLLEDGRFGMFIHTDENGQWISGLCYDLYLSR
jgi:hypothetical protein